MQCVVRRLALSQKSLKSSNSAECYALIHRYFTTLRLEKQLTRPTDSFELLDFRLWYSRTRTRDFSDISKNSSEFELRPGQRKQEDPQPIGNPQENAACPDPENWSPFYRRLALALPHTVRQRPTREDFLNVADGFWARTRIRFKWFTIRSFGRFGIDDISAFVTWFLMSQTLWILIGTTTFFSVVFATLNSLSMQEYVARAISDYLTKETGLQIAFESAIVPNWKDSRISFKNVSVSRNLPNEDDHTISNQESMVQLTIDSVDVTLSLLRWLEGKGVIRDAIIKGVRGDIDRRFIFYDPTLEPASFRHMHTPGTFHLTSLQLDDILVTLHQSNHRPFAISIFNASVNTFRKRWLFYDLLREADAVVGMYDGCLFSLHLPQLVEGSRNEKAKMARFRIDGVNISHLQSMTSAGTPLSSSPISWIKSGKVDAVLDFRFPHDPSEDIDIPAILSDIATNISSAASGRKLEDQTDRRVIKGDQSGRVLGQKELVRPALHAPSCGEDDSPFKVSVDIDLRFRDVKAAVPLWKSELSYSNSALIRPIVAFMNANRTLIPISCRLSKDLEDFDGAWTLWETGLMDDMSLKVYEALAYHVSQNNINNRLKSVSLWSLQVTAKGVIGVIQNILDPVATHIRDIYLSGGVGG